MTVIWLRVSLVVVLACLVTAELDFDLSEDVGFSEGDAIRSRGLVSLGFLAKPEDSSKLIFVRRCLASVIRPMYPMVLLTAAHCVYYKTIDYKWTNHGQYYVAVDYRSEKDMNRTLFGHILEIEYPEVYDSNQKRIFGDIAVVAVNFDGMLFKNPGTNFDISMPTDELVDKTISDASRFVHLQSEERNVAIFGWDKDQKLKRAIVKPLKALLCRRLFTAFLQFNNKTPWIDENGEFDPQWLQDTFTSQELRQIYSVDKSTHRIKNDEICGFDLEFSKSNCHGDSGGAMMDDEAELEGMNYDGPAYILGVTSSGLVQAGCDPRYPVIFASTQFYRDWIKGARACILLKMYHTLKKDLKKVVNLNIHLANKQLKLEFKTRADANIDYYTRLKKDYPKVAHIFMSIMKDKLYGTKKLCSLMGKENARFNKINAMTDDEYRMYRP